MRRHLVIRILLIIIFPVLLYSVFRHFLTVSVESRQPSDSFIPTGCSCIDPVSGIAYDFCYGLPFNETARGRRFSCDWLPILKSFDLVTSDIVDSKKSQYYSKPTSFIFVTAASESHFQEVLALIRTIQQYFPSNQRIIFYDLGLNGTNRKQIRRLCNVEYRSFPFSEYPSWIKNLHEFRWKPLIIAETLKEFGSIWYMDSSIRFNSGDLSKVYPLLFCENDTMDTTTQISIRKLENCKRKIAKFPYLLHGATGHGVFTATHPDVYKFFPTEFDKLKNSTCQMYEAGFVFIIRTRQVVRDILKWYVLCALEIGCMGPRASIGSCSFNVIDRYSRYAKCHRFDQSIVNLLLANLHDYNSDRWSSGDHSTFYSVHRDHTLSPIEKAQLKQCNATGRVSSV